MQLVCLRVLSLDQLLEFVCELDNEVDADEARDTLQDVEEEGDERADVFDVVHIRIVQGFIDSDPVDDVDWDFHVGGLANFKLL